MYIAKLPYNGKVGVIISNKKPSSLMNAYIKACELTKLCLHNNSKTEELIVVDEKITDKAKEDLLKYGFDSFIYLNKQNKVTDETFITLYCWFTCLGDAELELVPLNKNNTYVNFNTSTHETLHFNFIEEVEAEKPKKSKFSDYMIDNNPRPFAGVDYARMVLPDQPVVPYNIDNVVDNRVEVFI